MENCIIAKKGSRMALIARVAVISVFLAVVLTMPFKSKNAEAAITVDSVSSAVRSSAGNSLTFSHTVGESGTNRLLVVGVSIRHDDSNYTISATYAGVPMTSAGRSSRKEALSEIFYLVAPATGTNNVVVTLGKSLVFGAGAISFTGVGQTVPLGTFFAANGDATTVPSLNVTNVNQDEVVIDILATGDVQTSTLTVGSGQTVQWKTQTTVGGKDVDTFVAGSTEPAPVGGGTVTMSWTPSPLVKWALGAVAIKPPPPILSSPAVLTSARDTYIEKTSATTNYGANTTFSVEGENTRLKRALLLFDLSSIPPGVTITSATLTLEKVGGDAIADTIGVHALTRSWVEGNSTAGSGATWNTYNGTNNWTTGGGDFNATPVASATVTAGNGPQNWDVTGLVRDWLNGTLTNYGMLLKRNPEADGNMPIHNFSSREGTVAPKLTITYVAKTIDCNLSDWCNSSNDFCMNDEGGNDDWNSPAKLDITKFGFSSNLGDRFYILMGFDDTPPNGATAATLIDTDLDGRINFAYIVTVDSGTTTVQLYSCNNTLTYGCGGAALVKTYAPSDYCRGTAAGPWNNDTFVEAQLPFSDLGFSAGNIVLTSLVSYAGGSSLSSPKDSIFGVGSQNYNDRVRYDTSNGGNQKIPGAATYSISGIVYADEGVTPIGAGKTVRVLVNGTDRGTAVTDATGGYIILPAVSLAAGDVVLVYLDDDATDQGTAVTVLGGIQIVDLDIFANSLITRQDNSGVLSNANLSTAKGGSSDPDILYSVSGADLSVSGANTVLYLPAGYGFSPGGNVTTPNMKSLGTFNGGGGTIDVNGALTIAGGTFTASSGTMYVAGNFSISGATFHHNSGTMTFDGTDATISVGTATLYNMTVDKTNYSLTLASSLTVTGNLNVTSGILNQGASNNLTAGPVTIATDGTLRNRGTGGFTLSGNVDNSGKIDFNGGGDDLCGTATKILIRSSVNGAQRSWSGSGIFDMVDVDVRDQAGSANITVYGGTDSGNNGINWTFNAGCTGAPTAVTLALLKAIDHNGDVLITWRTGYEVNNLGFHVYREEEGKIERLTPEIIAGSALLTAVHMPLRSGRSYMWVDSHHRNTKVLDVKYWLEDVDLSGKLTWHGPVMPEENPESRPEWFTPQYLSELSRNMEEHYEEYQRIKALKKKLHRKPAMTNTKNGSTLPIEGLAVPQNTAKKLPLSDVELQRAIANQKTAKIYVKEAGWYRLKIGDLKAAGFRVAHPKHLRLYSEGREIPILMNSKKTGTLGVEDTIEFYGEEVDSPSTDSQVYWLSNMSGSGARVSRKEEKGEHTPSTSFPFTIELKERMFYFAALRNGDRENFFGAIVTAQPIDKILTISHLDPAPVQNATLEVALQGVTESPHTVKVLVNDHEIGEVTFEGQARGQAQLVLPQSLLLEGDNLLTLAAQGGEMDVSLVDSVKLTYWHTYATSTDTLKLSAEGGSTVSVGGFSSPNVMVVDITDPSSPIDVVGSARGEGTGYSCTFGVPGEGVRTLLAFTEEKVKSPSNVVLNKPSQWHKVRNGYDVVIISHKDFLAGLEPLKKLRQSQRLRVAVIDVEDLYDEFSFGKKAPGAIKDFLRHAKLTWRRPPRFVLLVGDASFDPRNYLGGGYYDLVPTKLVETSYLETASDDWFTDFDGDGLPEMAIGRLPVRTAEEASTVVSKILGYERANNIGTWKNQMLLVADENGEFDFESANEALRNLFPPGAIVDTVFKSQYADDEQAKNDIVKSMNQGALLVNYIGHGSEETWGSNIFTSEDGKSLTNGLKLPFVIAMTCLNGYFHDIYTESIAETLLKAQQGGALAVVASSGLTEPNGQAILNRELIRLLFRTGDESPTLGETLLRSKSAVRDPDIRRTWMLFGDPATRLQAVLPEKVRVRRANGRSPLTE